MEILCKDAVLEVGELPAGKHAAGVHCKTLLRLSGIPVRRDCGYQYFISDLEVPDKDKARGIITAEEQLRLHAKAEELYHEARTQPGMPYEAFNESLATRNLYPLCGVQRKSKPVGRPRKQN